ncbi:ABC-three component system protein [Paenibacillus chitinolyticus]|uniref:ABC-three component system protein n=1 Tax=Paenibacillus chitinolyticus TaxID=79263 RepID=UPI00367117C3
MSTNIHSAQASMLGYRFQPLYALLVLWQESEDDFDEISVESDDDVVLKSNYTKLYQLKHSTGKSGSLTVKNDGFWKTIRIWAPYADSSDHKFYFVTGDSVNSTSPLHKLVTGDLDRRAIVKLLMDEAKSVIDERSKAITKKANKLPYESKIHGCEAFINLNPKQRSALIEKITIRPNSFNISQVHALVIDQLGQTVIKKLRPLIAQRLLEWWDYRMLHTSKVNKSELLIQLQNFIAQIQDNNLPDDFSRLTPTSIDYELGGFMEKQIDLVNGGKSRKRKAAVARWRARNQRERWIADDVLNAIELKEYDDLLIESWGNRHEPMKEDLEGETEELCKKRGLELLDWVHDDSHLHIHPIRSEWKQYFLIHGSFQQLSEELKVGWHPKYYEMLRSD